MTRRTQRLYEQRRRAIVDARQQELLDDAARLRAEPSGSTTRVGAWWRCDEGGAETALGSTCSNTSWLTNEEPVVMRPRMDDAGCQWPRTNGYSPPDGSWKTRCKRKSCNRPSSGTRDASSSDDSSQLCMERLVRNGRTKRAGLSGRTEGTLGDGWALKLGGSGAVNQTSACRGTEDTLHMEASIVQNQDRTGKRKRVQIRQNLCAQDFMKTCSSKNAFRRYPKQKKRRRQLWRATRLSFHAKREAIRWQAVHDATMRVDAALIARV